MMPMIRVPAERDGEITTAEHDEQVNALLEDPSPRELSGQDPANLPVGATYSLRAAALSSEAQMFSETLAAAADALAEALASPVQSRAHMPGPETTVQLTWGSRDRVVQSRLRRAAHAERVGNSLRISHRVWHRGDAHQEPETNSFAVDNLSSEVRNHMKVAHQATAQARARRESAAEAERNRQQQRQHAQEDQWQTAREARLQRETQQHLAATSVQASVRGVGAY